MSTQACILIVDDEPDLRSVVRKILTRAQYEVVEAQNGDEMRQTLKSKKVDLVLLDLMLKGEDGLALAREIRRHSDVGLIMLTGKADLIDRVVGLEVGADDYLTKPFHHRELTARIASVLRRGRMLPVEDASIDDPDTDFILFNEWALDLSAHKLSAPDGTDVALTTHEFQLLAVLVQNPKRALSREYILRLVSGRGWHPDDRSIDVIVGKLRKKLKDNSRNPAFIKTVRQQGYMFIADTQRQKKRG